MNRVLPVLASTDVHGLIHDEPRQMHARAALREDFRACHRRYSPAGLVGLAIALAGRLS